MATLIASCSAVIGWLSSFFARLWHVAALPAFASVLISLCSQIFQIAAFLLPLKVMILLGSSSVPSYFPRVFTGIERERLILLLAVTAVVLYVAHLLMDFIGAALARRGSAQLIESDRQDEALLARQQKVALSFYRGFVTVAAGGMFAFGVLVFLGVFRPPLLLVVLGYFVVCFLVATLLFAWLPEMLASAAAKFARVIDVLSACGFLSVFGFLVMDFLYGGAEGLLLGILILLLCRQMFSRLSMALKNVERLYSNRQRFLILTGELRSEVSDNDDEEVFEESADDFLHASEGGGNVSEPLGILDGSSSSVVVSEQRPVVDRPTYRQLIAPEHCRAWIIDALNRAGISAPIISIEQWNESLRGQLMLHVRCAQPQSTDMHFLFKAFNRTQTQLAAHAASLLAVFPGSAAPGVLDASERYGFGAHLYPWVAGAFLASDAQSILDCREQVLIESWAWPVPSGLSVSSGVETLAERCNSKLWARCQAFSRWLSVDTRQLVDTFAHNPRRLSKALGCLPLRVHNPDVVAGRVYKAAEGYKVTYWGRWTLEPVGSGWPLELGFERLNQAFAQAAVHCEPLRGLSPLHVQLAALTFAFEAQCEQGAYIEAFVLLGQIRDTLDQLEI